MKFGHLHIPVQDLPAALDWLASIWEIRPSFEDPVGGMAVVSAHGVSLILDRADEDGVVTVGFTSDDCDADHRAASERGAETLEPPTDRPWGSGRHTSLVRGPSRSRSSRSFRGRTDF